MTNLENKDVLLDQNSTNKNIKVELMRYRKNSLSYTFGLMALILSILAAFIGLNSLRYDFTTLIKILVNIGVLLFGFLYSEQAKTYSKNGSIGLIVLGGVCFLRTLWTPRILLFGTPDQWGKILNPDNVNINWLPQDATMRGIIALVLLILAGTSFLCAGLIGYKKSVALENYMESIKEVH